MTAHQSIIAGCTHVQKEYLHVYCGSDMIMETIVKRIRTQVNKFRPPLHHHECVGWKPAPLFITHKMP